MQEQQQSDADHPSAKPSNDTMARNIASELSDLRNELERVAHDVRMKSKGAGAEVQDTRRALEEEIKRFSADIAVAADQTRQDLKRTGKDLHSRLQKLANQIVLPPS